MSDSAAGWQPDPNGKHDHRYWDGTGWTDNVADGGVAGTDPYEAPAESAAEPELPAGEPEAPTAEEPTVVTPVAAVEHAPAADTTAPYPTATTPPGAPPPYVPPTPAAGGGGSGGAGGGGSKRGLVIGGAILAAVVLAVVAFLALSGDDDDPTEPLADDSEETTTTDADNTDDESTDGGEGPVDSDGFSSDQLEEIIADTYEETLGLSRDQAECLAGKMTEAIEDGSLTEEQAFTEVFDYLSDCDISLDELSNN